MDKPREYNINVLAGEGKTEELKKLFIPGYTQREIDEALTNATAYSQIETAEYLLSLGADFSALNYEGVYYAAHNNEIAGLKFAISKGVDINTQNGMILNTAIFTCINTKNTAIIKWLF